MSDVKVFALGGLDETGRNMYCIENKDEIIAIECGIKYPDAGQLGVEYVIPDFQYLLDNKDRFKGVLITHAHDDAMAALSYLLKQINVPVYASPLTAELIKSELKKAGVLNPQVNRIERNGEFMIGKTRVRSFGTTHSIPDSIGVAIETSQGYVVYSGEYIIDTEIRDAHYQMDLDDLTQIGDKGVLVLLTESAQAMHVGYTSPLHSIAKRIEQPIAEAPGRIFITAYSQNFFRISEILQTAADLNKKVYFYNEEERDIIKAVEKLGYYQMPSGLELPRDQFSNDLDDEIILVTGSGNRVFRSMNKIAMNEDPQIELRPSDTVIIASPVVGGTEKGANQMENELYKEDVNVITMSGKDVLSMHASTEDLKMLIYLLKPKYYIPVKGSYRLLLSNAQSATDMGLTPDKIVLLDNGQVAVFRNKSLVSCTMDIDVQDILIDGDDNLDIASMVLKDRENLSTDGVIVVGIVCDHKTKEIIGGPDVQSRGVFYLKDADYIVKNIGNMITDIVQMDVRNGTYENLKARAEARDKIQKYVLRETGKRPMILPAILEINVPGK